MGEQQGFNRLRLLSCEDISSGSSSGSLTEVFYGSTSDSVGRSSTGSIPWAEDAIRQNQLEWERIERVFYGEEELPSDPKTRQEFLEWMNAFPHLRVSGNQIPVYYDSERFPEAEGNFEEVICIDPPPQRKRKSYFSETRSGHIQARRGHALGSIPPTSATLQVSRPREMHNGSITSRESQRVTQRSRPKSPERAVNLSTRLQRLDITKLDPVMRPPRRETLLQSRSSNALLPGGVIRTTELPVYHVAHRLEPMPPIINLRLVYRGAPGASREEPVRNKGSSVLLPAIQGKHLAPHQEFATRSISAINRRQMENFTTGVIQSASRFKGSSPVD